MINYALINISLQLYAAMMLLVLIVCQLMSRYKNEKKNHIFLQMLWVNFCLLILDSISWLTDGSPEGIGRSLMLVSNFWAYILVVVSPVILIFYTMEHISPPGRVMRAVAVICRLVLAGYVILVIVTQFNGALYYFDEHNICETGEYYYVMIVAGLGLLFFDVCLVLYYHKRLDLRSTVSYLVYPLLPTIFVWVNLFYPDIMIAHVGSALSFLIVYVNVHLQQEKKLEESRLEMERNRMAIMISQIQPHFLYNALNAIGNLCSDNPKAQKAVIMFSEYMRTNMDSITRYEPILFEEEMKHVEHYLWLEQLRFEERLQVEYDIRAKDFSLPALTIQPIVENAVRYGITKKKAGGTITIHTEEVGGVYRIVITDDGVGFDTAAVLSDSRSHIGIANVRSRLAAMCDGTLVITSILQQGTVAVIEIPGRDHR